MNVKYLTAIFLSVVVCAQPQASENEPQQSIPLTVPASVPLRVYLTKRVPKKVGAPVEAKLLEGVYAFDREVIPAGTVALGHVSRLESVSKFERTKAVLGGDFTPLHRADVEFTSLRLADGRELAVQTQENVGLNSIFSPPRPSKNPKAQKNPQPQQNPSGVLGTGKQSIKDQINARINRVRGVGDARSITDMVRGPNKMERLSDYFMAKLPYHPQFVRNGTRFDAELRNPLNFGSAPVTRSSMLLLGSQPPPDSIVHARLITPLDSGIATQGQQVNALLTQPLFSPDHKLVLPEGTRLSGSVVVAKKARWFHRTGQLRFNFQDVDLPQEVAQLKFPEPAGAAAPETQVATQKVLRFRSQAILKGAEGGSAPVKVDSEGGVKATESKTRFIQTAVAVLIARSAADDDAGKLRSVGKGPESNVGGRTLGGGLGFGLLGSLLSQSSKYVGTAFGYYGLGWSVYSTVIARGPEVQFDKNAVVDIGFNPRSSATASK
jgi:hypothetical protein